MSKTDKATADIPTTPTLQPESVKQQIIRIHPMGLLSLLMTNNKIGVKNGVVAGTKYVGGGYDSATNTFFLHIANDNFPEVAIGDRLPDLKIELEDLNAQEGTEDVQGK